MESALFFIDYFFSTPNHISPAKQTVGQASNIPVYPDVHFLNTSNKKGLEETSKPFKMVAGTGFEPATSGL